MYNITSKELRKQWIEFYEKRGHVDIGTVSLIGDGTTGVLFNVAGMQPLMPYLLGKKHPLGTRLCNVQGCVRTNDIEEVGDSSHVTFFEMMGSWSLGDYFKEERVKWTYEFLKDVLKLPMDRIATTVFEGDDIIEKDMETYNLKKDIGFLEDKIYFLPKSENWWELEVGPCGPDSEIFYITDKEACSKECTPACDCGHFVEIGNDVFMQYEKLSKDNYTKLNNKNVDTGWGLERILAFLTANGDVYMTDLFKSSVEILENAIGKKYGEDDDITYSMRVIADHIRTSVMLLGDKNHLVPSNIGAGYILRRLIRRATRHAKKLNVSTDIFDKIALNYIENIYIESYPNLKESEEFILTELRKEVKKFNNTISLGIKEFNKISKKMDEENITSMDGNTSFRLYDTYGFPIELTVELAKEKGYTVDLDAFEKKFREHQEISKAKDKGENKGGLESTGEMETKYHTATHLLNAALKVIVNENIHQRGSNITADRMRFDFNCDHKLTDEEKTKVEELVNTWIKEDLKVEFSDMKKEDALKSGAECMFPERYPDVVKVYTIGDVSKEVCGGPHVTSTSILGKFVITKEEASSSGVRRIKAKLV